MTEVEMKKNITKIIASVFHYNGLELIEETYLNYQESYKLNNFEIIEDDDEAWSEDNLNYPYFQMLTQTVQQKKSSSKISAK